ASLTVTAGTLINAPGATIVSLATGGSTRALNAQLDNQGTITVNQALSLGRANAAHQHSGTIDLAGGDLIINLNSGTSSFTTTGAFTIPATRTLTVNGGTFNYSGGTFSGAGTFAISTTTLNLAQSFSNSVTAFSPVSSVINGPGALTNAAGQTLTLNGSTVNAPLDNQGLLIAPSNSIVNGALTTSASSTLRVQSNGQCCGTTLTVANGFTNTGLIELTNINAGGQSASLTVT